MTLLKQKLTNSPRAALSKFMVASFLLKGNNRSNYQVAVFELSVRVPGKVIRLPKNDTALNISAPLLTSVLGLIQLQPWHESVPPLLEGKFQFAISSVT